MKLFASLVEKITFWSGVPVGGMWLLLLTFGGGIYVINEYPFYTQRDLMIGFVAWVVAYGVLWLGYGREFWMSSDRLKELRHSQFEDVE